jgi:hypothetical protein
VRMVEPIDGIRIRINVEQSGTYNKSYNGQYTAGLICPVLQWEIQKNNEDEYSYKSVR